MSNAARRAGVSARAGMNTGNHMEHAALAHIGGPGMKSVYTFECFDRHGNLKWAEKVGNLVVNQGLNDILDKYFKGSTYTASWHVGLIDDASFGAIAATDTAAKIVDAPGDIDTPTTNGWAEFVDYDEATREALTLGSVASQSVDNAASKASFTISGAGDVNGAFVISNNTKGGTSGFLYGAASFMAPRAVEEDDVLNVTVELTAAAA